MQQPRTHFSMRRLWPGPFTGALLSSLLLILAMAAPIHAAPPLPSSFYGSVHLSGQHVPAGTAVTAWIDGALIAETTTTWVDGMSVYTIDVLGDDPDTPVVEGGVAGKTIIFQVDGVSANQTAIWQAETYVRLDLTADHAPTPPVAIPQTLVTAEDTPLPILLAGSDANNDPLTFRVVDPPQHGVLSGDAPNLLYRPHADFHGMDSFTFVANDGVFDSNVATIAITIQPVNDPPVLDLILDQVMDEGAVLTLSITASDVDGDPLTLSASGLPSFASFADHGNGAGTLSLAPGYAAAGYYPNLTIAVSDGALSASRSFAVTVLEASPLPTAAFATGYSINFARLEDGATIANYSNASNSSPESAIDSSTSTYWQTGSGQHSNQWITVDLMGDDPHLIGRVAIRGENAVYAPRNFEIRVSKTGTAPADFTTIYSGVVERANQLQYFDFPPVLARYVQFFIVDTHGSTSNLVVRNFQVLSRPREGGIVSLADGPAGATIVAFSSQSNATSRSAVQAINYETTNYWLTANGAVSDQWIKVMLKGGNAYPIDRIMLRGPKAANAPRHFQLRVATESADDSDFTTILAATLPADGLSYWYHFPPTPAMYVQLWIQDAHGGAAVDNIQLNEFQVFAADQGGASVPFNDASSRPGGEIVQWHWDFGDGATSTEQHPLHTYAQPGTYMVTLTVVDGEGQSDSATMHYTVLPGANVDFTWTPEIPNEGQQTRFSDLSTPDEGDALLVRIWTTSDGTTSSSQTFFKTFGDNGDYTVTLSHLDSNFITTALSKTVSVLNLPPVVNAGPDAALPVLDPWHASSALVNDPGSGDASTLICTWDFGDGHIVQIDAPCNHSRARISHIYTSVGVYTATLTAVDKDGGVGSDTAIINVRERDTRLSIYRIASVSDFEADVHVVLWDFDAAAPMAGSQVELAWDGGTALLIMDEFGLAVMRLPFAPGQEVTLTAHYAGNEHYAASTVTVDAVVAESTVEFWLTFPTILNNGIGSGGYSEPSLYIASERATSGIVEVAGLNFRAPFTVIPGEATKVILPLNVRVSSGTFTEEKAIYVTAIHEIQVYGLNYTTAASDAYLGLPTHLLGKEYMVASRSSLAGTQLAVVPVEDNTTIWITPTLGTPGQVVLNQGQVYQYYPKLQGDLTGSLVSADKPIAVFGGSNCAFIPDNQPFCNHLIEQHLPINTWGKEYITMPMAGRSKIGDYIRILAANDNTTVTFNGNVVATLHRGQYHEEFFTAPLYIQTDEPVMVIQYARGSSVGGNPGDPTMMLIPPYEQFLDRYPAVVSPDHTFTVHFITVLAPDAAVGEIRLDGAPIPASTFTPITGSGFSGAQVQLLPGSHTLDGPLPFGIFMYGYGSDDNYGYVGGLTLGEIVLATEILVTPETATQLVDQEHCVLATVQDENGNPLDNIRVDFLVSGAHSRSGQSLTRNGNGARFCYIGNETGSDTITARIGDLMGMAAVAWIDALPDLILVKESSAPSVRAGEIMTYTLTVANSGTTGATAVALTDTLPTEVTFLAASHEGAVADGVVTWPVFSLAAGASAARTVAVQVNSTVPEGVTVITNVASAFNQTLLGDLNPEDNVASVTTALITNAPPIAVDDEAETNQNTPVEIDVLGNDSDVDGDALTIVTVGMPGHGAAVVSGPSSVVYTPEPGFHGADSFTYTISDGEFEATATVTVIVLPVNDAPVADSQTITTDEDIAVAITLSGSDVEGDELTFHIITEPEHGILSGEAPDLLYTPAADYHGEDSFTFVANDGELDSEVATITLIVEPVNDAPVAVDDEVTTEEDTPVEINVLANDSDVDGDALTIVALGTPGYGTTVVGGPSSVVYTPTLDFNGTDVFTYTISDGEFEATATVTVTVLPVNDAPIAMDDEVETDLDLAVVIRVLDNDYDVDGDAITVIAITQPVTGTATLHADGTVTYTPAMGFRGADHFTYTISDGELEATATVIVRVVLPPVIVCELYPIALHAATVEGATPGAALPDVFNGTGPGNFGWLTWTGNPNAPTLANNLTPPGGSHTYVNPHDPADTLVSVGDWVQGSPGVANAKPVRDALDALLGQEIVVPVWDAAQGQGNNAQYRVADFARIRLTDYHLPGQNRISAVWLGSAFCGETDLLRTKAGDTGYEASVSAAAHLLYLPNISGEAMIHRKEEIVKIDTVSSLHALFLPSVTR